MRPRKLACGVLGAALLLAGARPGLALDPGKAITQYVHDVWQTEQGLPQSSVLAIVQTRDGYLWLGTEEGLVRFDGVRFTVFDTKTTPELGDNYVLCLFEDRAGRLWIGTFGGGIVRLEGGRFTRFGAREGLPGTQVKALVEDRGGRLWVGTLGGGLARLEGGRFVREPSRDALGARVRTLLEDREGALWVGTEAGLARLKDGTLTSFTTKEGLSNDNVNSLHEDREGSLWIGTLRGGLNRLKDSRFTAFTKKQGLSNDTVRSLHEDRDGSLWIGTDGGGLDRLKDGRFTAFTTKEGLSNDSVVSLHEDREGSLWIGTNGGGLNRLRDGRLTAFTTKEGLSNDIVWSVYEDQAGSLWIGTQGGGLNRLKDGRFTAFTTKEGLSNDSVLSLHEDREGSLWIGTGGGLNRLRDGFTAFTTKEGLSNDNVLSLHEDREGSLWIGTQGGGLNRLKDARFTTFTTKEGLSNDIVQSLHEDREGSLWIGTNGGGLNRLKNGRFAAFTAKEGLSSDNVNSLHEDREGSLWIGTVGGGLNRLKDGRFRSITTREGLFDDTVFQILEDDRGYFWMSCNKGIFRVAKQELTEVAEGRRPRVTSVAYGTADGMKSAECNGGGQPAGWKTRDGRLWFPTIRGVVVVDPAHLPKNTLRPPVVVEEVLADERVADRSGPLRLPAGTRALEIHYTALSLRNPAKVRFKYRLEGFDDGWVEAGTRRTAYYTKVPHGEYRFRVIACNDDGLWNEEGAALAVAVEPRFYERRWFRLLAALLVLAALTGAYRVRVWHLKTRERELVAVVEERTQSLQAAVGEAERARGEAEEHERQAEAQRTRAEEASRAKSQFLANMSHELRTPLNAIIGYSEMLEEEATDLGQETMVPDLERIQGSGRHLLTLINDILDLSKVEAGKMPLLPETFAVGPMLSGVVTMVRPLVEKNGNVLELRCPEGLEDMHNDATRVRQILFNLLSNACKFTKDGTITLDVRRDDVPGMLRFAVRDTGIGMTPEQLGRLFQAFAQAEASTSRKFGGTGLGLVISLRFAQLMGGTITVESAPGLGTTFTAIVPMSIPDPRDEPARAVAS